MSVPVGPENRASRPISLSMASLWFLGLRKIRLRDVGPKQVGGKFGVSYRATEYHNPQVYKIRLRNANKSTMTCNRKHETPMARKVEPDHRLTSH